MTNAKKPTAPVRRITRLDAQPQRAARLEVDRAFPGAIRGASLITTGPAEGHGFAVDKTTVEQVAAGAEGLRGRWTHGALSDDGLGRHLGAWRDVRAEAFWLCRACSAEQAGAACAACGGEAAQQWRAVGDFEFARTAHQLRPDGLDVPAPVYLMDRAEEDPRSLGISVVARFSFERAKAAKPADAGDDGEGQGAAAAEGAEGARLARLPGRADLLRGDWVADPAANPIGLHAGTSAPSELTEGAKRVLDQIVAREGKDKAKTRALAYLARYFGDAFGKEERSHEPDTLRARVDALTGELRELRAVVAAYREADEARAEDEAEALVARLREESTALNAPIPAADLERVAALLGRGDVETATALGEALLARSEAMGQAPFRRGGPTSLDKDRDRAKASVAARLRLLRRRGWTATVSEDGTEITEESPPRTGGKP